MIYVCVVSHFHDDLLMGGELLSELSGSDVVRVFVKDNVQSARLRHHCGVLGIEYIDSSPNKGFGENNNIVFQHIKKNVGFGEGDFFVAINPDILLTCSVLIEFVNSLRQDTRRFGTLNLFKDRKMKIHDWSIRKFPTLMDIFASRVFGTIRNKYEKENIDKPCAVDWGSGAFLAFDWKLFEDLGGFDERYFMYFEDVDISWRAKRKFNVLLYYYPQYKAIHLARHANRKLISWHAVWFLKSFMLFKFVSAFRISRDNTNYWR